MNGLLVSTGVVALAEIGDKTQLLALVLALSLLPVSAVAETDVGLDLSKFTFTLVAGTCKLNNFV